MNHTKEEKQMLIDVQALAARLRLSTRTIFRLNDLGHIPRPVRIGRSVRWRLDEVEAWVRDGCPIPRQGVRNGGKS